MYTYIYWEGLRFEENEVTVNVQKFVPSPYVFLSSCLSNVIGSF